MERRVQRGKPFAHANQAEAARTGSRHDVLHVEPNAIIADRIVKEVAFAPHPDCDARGARVSCDVRQRFLSDPIGDSLDLTWKPSAR